MGKDRLTFHHEDDEQGRNAGAGASRSSHFYGDTEKEKD